MSLYGRQGKIVAKPGQRATLVEMFRKSISADAMPGCRLYLIGTSETDEDTLLISEVWNDEAAHKASLTIPLIRDLIGQAMPLIEKVEGDGFDLVSGWA